LKPENFLFLTEADDAPVKIIDFGLSRHDDTDLGIMQTKVGTPYYVAPEVLRREYTNMCDIWSIGVITYILLCGYPPFYGDSDTQIFESVRIGKFDFPSPEWDEISESAKEFVIAMLKKDPNRRYGGSRLPVVVSLWRPSVSNCCFSFGADRRRPKRLNTNGSKSNLQRTIR
jgi:calcium-dependent protein kinase